MALFQHKPLTIGRVAKATGLGVETIRYYEREKLILPPARSDSGYRHYDESAIERIEFIIRAKALGFTLHEIKELLNLHDDPDTTCADFKARAEQKISQIQQKINALQEMRENLSQVTEACPGDSRDAHDNCPILNSLSHSIH